MRRPCRCTKQYEIAPGVLHNNRVKFPNGILLHCSVHQHGCCDVRCKPSIDMCSIRPYPDSETMIPSVFLASCVNEPSNSRTNLGPKRFLNLLHWPITRTEHDFKRQIPLKSMPRSLGPPQAATSKENFLKFSTTISSNCRPNCCLEVDEHDLKITSCGKEQKDAKVRCKKGFILSKTLAECCRQVSHFPKSKMRKTGNDFF